MIMLIFSFNHIKLTQKFTFIPKTGDFIDLFFAVLKFLTTKNVSFF